MLNPTPADEPTADQNQDLLAIAHGLADEFQRHSPDLRVFRDGRLQITIFCPLDFRYLQVVVSLHGVYLVEDPTKPIADDTIKRRSEKVYGPFPLEDPTLIKRATDLVDRWLKRHHS